LAVEATEFTLFTWCVSAHRRISATANSVIHVSVVANRSIGRRHTRQTAVLVATVVAVGHELLHDAAAAIHRVQIAAKALRIVRRRALRVAAGGRRRINAGGYRAGGLALLDQVPRLSA